MLNSDDDLLHNEVVKPQDLVLSQCRDRSISVDSENVPINLVVEPDQLEKHVSALSRPGCGCFSSAGKQPYVQKAIQERFSLIDEALPIHLLKALNLARQSDKHEHNLLPGMVPTNLCTLMLPSSVPIQIAGDYLSTFLGPSEEVFVAEKHDELTSFTRSVAFNPLVNFNTSLEVDELLPIEPHMLGIETGLEIVSPMISSRNSKEAISAAIAPMASLVSTQQGLSTIIGDGDVLPPELPPYPPTPIPPWQPPGFVAECEILHPWPNNPGPRRNPPKPGFHPPDHVSSFSYELDLPWWDEKKEAGNILRHYGLALPSTVRPASTFGFKALPPPYCPPDYVFDFEWQSCMPKGGPARRSPPPEKLHAHACKCPPGESWLVDVKRCWERGKLPPGAFPDSSEFATEPTELLLIRFDASNFVDWKYRRKTKGPGKCTGTTNDKVLVAFRWAYKMCRSAELELNYIANHPNLLHRRTLWGAEVNHGFNASWAYWFGTPSTFIDLDTRILVVHDYIKSWSRAFRTGFYKTNKHPVYIRCKSKECIGDGTKARHLVRNTIELCNGTYFGLEPEQRAITMLHEMGHFSSGNITTPRDERNNTFCEGGWNISKNMCYRDRFSSNSKIFKGGNPKVLADASFGSMDAFYTMVNNIDNYVCLMWNRWQDRQDQRFQL